MDIRVLTNEYAVSPQIAPEDIPAIAAAGFRTIICNQPDNEIVEPLQSSAIRAATEAAGLRFVDIPLAQDEPQEREIRMQHQAIMESPGPVLAYCAAGTRSIVAWMFGAAASAHSEDLIAAATKAGYPLAELKPQLDLVGAAGHLG